MQHSGRDLLTVARRGLTHLGSLAAHPLAFAMVALYAAGWAFLSSEPVGWHGGVSLVTLLIALLIQRAEYRDTQALHAKLDELLHAQTQASNALTRIDAAEPEEIEEHRQRAREND